MSNKIVWEKWVDPFLSSLEEQDSQDKDEVYKDSYERAEEKSRGISQSDKNYSGPVIVGPMGIIPLNESNLPSKIYCFWMGHTNFDITHKIQNLISEVPGVEALDIFTRYRFRVAVGKAFLEENTDPFGKTVLLSIEKEICSKEKVVDKQEKVVSTKLNCLKKQLNKKYKHWIIFSKSDGTLETKGAATKEELILEFDKRNDEAVATSWE